jgi:hypothetical protein
MIPIAGVALLVALAMKSLPLATETVSATSQTLSNFQLKRRDRTRTGDSKRKARPTMPSSSDNLNQYLKWPPSLRYSLTSRTLLRLTPSRVNSM